MVVRILGVGVTASIASQLSFVLVVALAVILVTVVLAFAWPDRDPIARWIDRWRSPPGNRWP